MLNVRNLACSRGDRPLFRDLSFSLEPGKVLHVQGPNGSGKTTLLRTLCGLSQPAGGKIFWNGHPTDEGPAAFRGAFHYLGHANALQGDLTGEENLRYGGCLAGEPGAVLTGLGLGRVASLPVKLLSQGQKRRTALARFALWHRPLWILDEPFSALDVRASASLLEQFTKHLQRDGMIILTSHQEVTLSDRPILTLSLEGRA